MDLTIFASRLKKSREKNGLSQKELARMLGRSVQTISNWENQVNFPGLDTFDKLCDILNVTSDYLLGRNSTSTLPVEDLSEDIVFDLKKMSEHLKERK